MATITEKVEARRIPLSVLVERHEAKYLIHPSIVPAIRDYIKPFCEPDPNCDGDPPEYVITTLQLDTPDFDLHYAKERERAARFKLRARIYGTDGASPVYVEVKRKINRVIAKSRARIPREKWCKELILDPNRKVDIQFKSEKETIAFLEYLRLAREINAEPTVYIRYNRESYISCIDRYARVTIDRNLLCQRARSWNSWGDDGQWRRMDVSLAQGLPFSGVVLELKALVDVPQWILDMTQEFDLVRTGNCKYSAAIWEESLFGGFADMPSYAADLLTW